MAYRGKIAGHFPQYTTRPNYDVNDIRFLPVGGGENDLLYIDKVYALPAGASISSVSDLEHYVVWEKISKVLTAGNDFVAIEYIPPEDITLSSISIFTASGTNINQTSVSLIIMHESGLPIATSTTSTFTHMTLYGLEGNKQTCSSFNYRKLYAGQKYYIIFEGSNHDFYPAYFQASTGNYKIYTNNQASAQSSNCFKYWDIEPSSPPKYIGNLTTSEGIFGLTPGSWFMWLNGYGAGISRWRMYRRTNVGSQYQFQGIVGDSPDNQSAFQYRHAVQLIQKAPTGDFIWYCQGTPHIQLSSGTIYTKQQSGSVQYTSNNTIAVDVPNDDTGERLVSIANVFKGLTQKPYVITGGGNTHYRVMGGYLFSLKSGYSNGFTDEPLTELPVNPQSNCIYYLSNTISGINYTGAYLYDGSWNLLTFGNDDLNISGIITDCLDIKTVDTVLTKVGEANEFLEEVKVNGNTVDVEQIFQTFFLEQNTDTPVPMYSDRKYYLEINGQEV